MNYRHDFHAGNHTEVFKHSALCLLLLELRKKPKRFTVLDTHAGAGMYDILSPKAQKTGEAQDGIGIVFGKDVPAASAYLQIIQRLNPNGLRSYADARRLSRAEAAKLVFERELSERWLIKAMGWNQPPKRPRK